MKLWKMLKGPRQALKKVKFIYEPYRKIKVDCISKKRNRYLSENGIQLVMDIDHALEQTNACYFVCAGTLLGIIRNGELIQWDLDIDFGIFIDQKFSWDDLEKTLKNIGFVLDHQFLFENKIAEQTYKKGNASVDFFNHFNVEDHTCYYSFYSKKDYKYDKEGQAHTFFWKNKKICGTKKLEFGSGNIHVPSEAEEYLRRLYGDDWQIPNPKWMPEESLSCSKLDDLSLGICVKCS